VKTSRAQQQTSHPAPPVDQAEPETVATPEPVAGIAAPPVHSFGWGGASTFEVGPTQVGLGAAAGSTHDRLLQLVDKTQDLSTELATVTEPFPQVVQAHADGLSKLIGGEPKVYSSPLPSGAQAYVVTGAGKGKSYAIIVDELGQVMNAERPWSSFKLRPEGAGASRAQQLAKIEELANKKDGLGPAFDLTKVSPIYESVQRAYDAEVQAGRSPKLYGQALGEGERPFYALITDAGDRRHLSVWMDDAVVARGERVETHYSPVPQLS
jgi:hypothetical protein